MRAVVHLAGNVAPVFAGLVTAPLTARSLGPAARGELAIVLLISVFVGLVGALGLGLLARHDVAANPGTMHAWSKRGRRISGFSVTAALVVGVGLGFGLGLRAEELIATAVLFTLAGMSASKSVDANILIVSGYTKQFGTANLAASATICLGIVGAFVAGVLTLWLVIGLNAASLVVQMILIVVPRAELLKRTQPERLAHERFGSLVRRAWGAWRAQVAEALVIRADSILIMAQASVQVVGLYAVTALIPQIAYQVFQTMIQHSYATAPLVRIRERTRILWQVCLAVSLPLSAAGGLAAFILVPILFGPSFIASLEWLIPACMVAIGLAGLAPILQHFAVSGRDSWFPIALLLGAAASGLCGVVVNTATGLVILAVMFLVTGGVYVYLVAGPRMFCVSWISIRHLFWRER